MARSLRILMLESNDADAEKLMSEIRAGGLQARYDRARDRASFLALLERGPWDLLLCDSQHDDMTARQAINLLRAKDLSLPVIVVGNGVDAGMAVSVMHAGAHDFVSKQDLSRLVPAMERELSEQAQQRRIEMALHESELWFRQLSDNIQEVFWLFDAKARRTLYLSPSFEDLWERPAQLMLDTPDFWLQTLHPDDHSLLQPVLQEQGWFALNHDYRILLADGSVRWIHTRCFPVPSEDGSAPRIAGISVDITEHKQLALEKDMLNRALQQSADAVMITDVNGLIVYVNAAFEDLSGYARHEVIGQRPSLLRSGFQDDGFYRHVWKSLVNGLPYTDVFINRRKDGELYYEAKTITPLRGANGTITHYVSTGKDITVRLKGRERLQQLLHYDAITGLASRVLLQDRLHQAILQSRRLQTRLGVVSLSLGLHQLLDSSTGHELYERMMRQAAERLQEYVDDQATLARNHGDEFVILLKNLQQPEQVDELLKRLLLSFAVPLRCQGYELFVSPVAGVSLYPDDSDEADGLLHRAAVAMEHARHYPASPLVYYQQGMRAGENLGTKN